MKRFVSFSAVLGLIIALNGVAHATDFDRVGRVDIITALTINENNILDFGTVAANFGFITLDTAGTITVDGSGIGAGGSVASGDYTISGEPSAVVQVVLTALGMPAGLALTNFVTLPADLSAATLSAGPGELQFFIGADLTVSAGVVTGSDQALNFKIAVTYQ